MTSPISAAEQLMLRTYDTFLDLLNRRPAAARSLAEEAAALAERYATANQTDRSRRTVRAAATEKEADQFRPTYSP
jgi:hypothetical protein